VSGREAGRRRRRGPARLARAWPALVLAVLAAGCVLGPRELDRPPGFAVVFGRIDLTGFAAAGAILDLHREGGGYDRELAADKWAAREFAITLPPGRYVIQRVKTVDDRRGGGSDLPWMLDVAFEVRAPVVYVGTLRLATRRPPRLDVEVADELDRALPAVRARYRGIGEPVRALFEPA
jgi:hypothetical protein